MTEKQRKSLIDSISQRYGVSAHLIDAILVTYARVEDVVIDLEKVELPLDIGPPPDERELAIKFLVYDTFREDKND